MFGKLEGNELSELRALWRAWDPIGVYVDPDVAWHEGEYDEYLWRSLRVLAESADGDAVDAVESFLRELLEQDLGLVPHEQPGRSITAFARQLAEWFKRCRLGRLG